MIKNEKSLKLLLFIKRKYFISKINILNYIRILNSLLKNILITALTLLVNIFPIFRGNFITFNENLTIQITIATTIVTILALMLTLSIIPIQKISETWSSAVARIYGADKKITGAFVSIAIFSILTFLCAKIGISFVFSGLIFLSITIDILRWYYKYICKFLYLDTVVVNLENFTKKKIDNYMDIIKRDSKYAYNFLTQEEKKNFSLNSMEIEIYRKDSVYKAWINRFIQEAAEIAKKSIYRYESRLLKLAINSLSNIVKHYLDRIKFYLLNKNACEEFTETFYRASCVSLFQVGKSAIFMSDESAAVFVSRGYVNIFEYIVNHDPLIHHLTFSPVFYFQKLLKEAKNKNNDEVVFQSVQILLNSVEGLSNVLYHSATYYQIFSCYKDTIIYLLIKRKEDLSNYLSEIFSKILVKVFNYDVVSFIKLLPNILDNILHIAVFIAGCKIDSVSILPRSVLSDFYDPHSSETSISYLFVELHEMIKKEIVEENKGLIYSHYLNISDCMHKHFISIAERCDFGDNILLKEIVYSIKYIVKDMVNLFKYSIGSKFEMSLLKEIKSYLIFFKVVIYNKSYIDFENVKFICDTLSCVGMQFSELSFFSDQIISICVNYLEEIIIIFCHQKNVLEVEISRLLMFFYQLRLIAESKKLNNVVNKVDKFLSTKIEPLTDAQWDECVKQFEINKHFLHNEIDRGVEEKIMSFRDLSEDLLIQLLSLAAVKNSVI